MPIRSDCVFISLVEGLLIRKVSAAMVMKRAMRRGSTGGGLTERGTRDRELGDRELGDGVARDGAVRDRGVGEGGAGDAWLKAFILRVVIILYTKKKTCSGFQFFPLVIRVH
jgi:hypothetical protein